jgi:hypothetical protein
MAKKSKSPLPKKLFGGGGKEDKYSGLGFNPAAPGIFNMGKRTAALGAYVSKNGIPGMKKGGSTKSKKKK